LLQCRITNDDIRSAIGYDEQDCGPSDEGNKPAGETRNIPLSKYYFLVRWEGFTEPTWEPYSGIKNLEPLDKYGMDHPGLKIPTSDS
jgi:hypothetical protein